MANSASWAQFAEAYFFILNPAYGFFCIEARAVRKRWRMT